MRAGAGRRFRTGLVGSLLGTLALLAAAPARPNRDGPPLGFSGGFGEPDCTACHFEAEVNPAPGSLALAGVPTAYTPGETYRVQLRLTRPGVAIGGFELTARFEDGGAQAGRLFVLPEDAGRVAVETSYDIEYVQHLRPGTTVVARDTAVWTVLWTAPSERGSAVLMHAAGNAADGDDSQFGDYIYTAMARSAPPSLGAGLDWIYANSWSGDRTTGVSDRSRPPE